MSKKLLALTGALLLNASPAAADHTPAHVTVHPKPSTLTSPSVLAREEEMRQTPGSVVLVPKESFDHKFAKSFKDTLAKTPGVFAQDRYGEEVRLSIRGSGISRGFHLRGIELLIDGVPVNLADGSGDFQEIDPANTQYLEVYKGANALRFGAATLGGAVNVVTPTAHNVDYKNLLRVDGGSFGNLRTHLATAQAGEKWDSYAALTLSRADGYREQSPEKKGRLSTNVGYKISDKAETRFYLSYNNLNQEVPGSLTRSAALNTPRSAPLTNKVNDNQRDVKSLRMSNVTGIQLTPQTKLELGAFVNDKDLFHPIFQVLDQESTDYGGFARANTGFSAFGLSHKVLYGVNYHGGKVDALQFLNVFGSRGAQTANADQKSQNVTAYGEGQFHVTPEVSAIVGGQALWAKREFVNNLLPASSDQEIYTQFNPKLGALWDINPASQMFANVSRSSEIPTFSEQVQSVGAPPVPTFIDLKAQTAWTAEIGTRGMSGNVTWDMAAYHARVKNEMLQFTTNPTIPASAFNADDTIHQGLELGASWRFLSDVWRHDDAWSIAQLYTLNDFRFDGDAQYGDNQIAGLPRHVLRTEVRYKQPNWSVAPIMEFAPQAPYVDFANTTRASDYMIFNLEAQAKVNDAIEVFAEGRNLTDQRYIANTSTVTNASVGASPAVYYPGDGRAFYAGMKVKF